MKQIKTIQEKEKNMGKKITKECNVIQYDYNIRHPEKGLWISMGNDYSKEPDVGHVNSWRADTKFHLSINEMQQLHDILEQLLNNIE